MSEKNNTATFDGFEQKLAQLQKIVDKLEGDSSVTLEESMDLFKDGLALTEQCVDNLNAMQTRIAELGSRLDLILRQPLFGEGNE